MQSKANLLVNKKQLFVLGIMNGTSLDGIDFVLTKISKKNKHIKAVYVDKKSFAFTPVIKKQLLAAAQHKLLVNELSLLHHELGRFYAACFKKLKPQHKKVDLIGLHGQTVFHQAPHATLQIGEASYLSAEAQVPVVCDFRVGDIALGGQGAPIASLFHQVVFAQNQNISVHNLGGISNLTMMTPRGVRSAFDTGPANMMLDLCMQKMTHGQKQYDDQGRIARQGEPHLELVGDLLKHAYFKKKPPKSCGREEFGEVYLNKFLQKAKALSDQDKMATLVEFTAWSIALSYKKFIKPAPQKIIFCGGGADNVYLLERIQALMPECQISRIADWGWPVFAIEGAAFALLAAYRIWGLPSNLPQTTGARRATSLGKIVEV